MNSNLKVGGILHNSLSNGDGMRLVLFFCGCSHGCPQCQNAHLQTTKDYTPMSVQDIMTVVLEQKDYIDGVTLSGGEPFEQDLYLLSELVDKLHENDINIWCYTGYTIQSLLDKRIGKPTYNHLLSILSKLNMLVDGLFIEELLDETNVPRGSTNQNLLTNEDLAKYVADYQQRHQ